GVSAADIPQIRLMEASATKAGAPLHVHFVYGGNHFDILDPLTRLVAQKISEDTGGGRQCNIRITDDEVQQAFAARRCEPVATLCGARSAESAYAPWRRGA